MTTILPSESGICGDRVDGSVDHTAIRRHVVLIGLPGVDISKIGLGLARELRRPFLNGDNAQDLQTDDRQRHDAVLAAAECAWFERVAATTLPAVIAPPPTVLAGGVDGALWERLWVVFLDASPVSKLSESDRGPGGDHERARRLSDFSYVCGDVDPGVAARVVARRWHRVHHL